LFPLVGAGGTHDSSFGIAGRTVGTRAAVVDLKENPISTEEKKRRRGRNDPNLHNLPF